MVRSYRSQGTQDRLAYSFGAEWRCAAEKGGSHALLALVRAAVPLQNRGIPPILIEYGSTGHLKSA